MKDKNSNPNQPPAAKGKGQKQSQERGTATNHKKNPGKRPHQGGN
jgi:hypothetical protein